MCHDGDAEHPGPGELHGEVELGHDLVVDQPLQRLDHVFPRHAQDFGDLLGPRQQPETRADRIVLAEIAGPAARILAAVRDDVIDRGEPIGEETDQDRVDQVAPRLKRGALLDPVAAAVGDIPGGGNVTHQVGTSGG